MTIDHDLFTCPNCGREHPLGGARPNGFTCVCGATTVLSTPGVQHPDAPSTVTPPEGSAIQLSRDPDAPIIVVPAPEGVEEA
jgi:hypothetical protein